MTRKIKRVIIRKTTLKSKKKGEGKAEREEVVEELRLKTRREVPERRRGVEMIRTSK